MDKTTECTDCGMVFKPQDWYNRDKSFLCETSIDERKYNDCLSNLSTKEREEYLEQLKEDLTDYSLERC
jgi:hypothetical protein